MVANKSAIIVTAIVSAMTIPTIEITVAKSSLSDFFSTWQTTVIRIPIAANLKIIDTSISHDQNDKSKTRKKPELEI